MLKDRLNERFIDYQNAYKRLKESTKLEINDDIIVDAVIQRFEFTFEMSWKLMKIYLEYQGIQDIQSPRSTIKAAFKYGLIEDGDKWIGMMLDRNRTSHVYDEKTALEIYNNVKKDYVFLLEKLLNKIEEVI
ncbi:nucleotidyltransferase [Clostridium sp. P21]|uniref:Nucleotidyltransferase n=1 Tax=Clostridium muellerianum TaxID=2716538 RepID=A0A7Y0EKD2_9CLOT|nr:nucleotidyltransferase substrate binding protein [Clostridium muellerianum]NMM65079.1 nucleotidyltransferase [Clostridium muellerianum]